MGIGSGQSGEEAQAGESGRADGDLESTELAMFFGSFHEL
jgi:hypothetical protein